MQAQAVHDYFTQLQSRIVAALEALEGAGFRTDRWQRPEGGGGVTRVIEDGRVFERGGVNFSRVQGSRLPPSATAARPQLAGQAYDAMGVSLVLHPRNPYCPTAHMNVRFFSAASAWWFGGGMDLTPYYGFEDDARHFHAACRDALAPFGADYYPRFKRECDEYFQLRHRGEPRGIGGIFFDDFADRDFDLFGSPAQWPINSSQPICRSWSAEDILPSGSAKESFRPTGAAATWNSTWCTTAARCSACSRAGAPNRS